MTGEKGAGRKAGLRVVLDTNVYLSVFLSSEKKLLTLWELALEGRYTLIVSPAIVREFMEKLRDKFGYSEEEREKIKRKLARFTEIVQPKRIPTAIPEDPNDNHILACAIAGKVDLIVSGDKDLLRLKEYEDIPVVRPMDLVRTLRGYEEN
jgi:putative PIN family toxin of toxin-antitoxin system